MTQHPTRSHRGRALQYAGLWLRLAVVAAALGWIAWRVAATPPDETPAPAQTTFASAPVTQPAPAPEPELPPPVEQTYQTHADLVAAALESIEAARAQQASAERRLAEVEHEFEASQIAMAQLVAESRDLGKALNDSSPRIARAERKLDALKHAKGELEGEIAALERVPKPRPKPLIDKSPVSKPPRGSEYHFELRDDRVAFIDMEELLDRLKVDARVQIRMMTIPRPLSGEAGPVGDFAIHYELVPVGVGVSSRYGSASVDAEFSLTGYEIVPVRARRGETLKTAIEPASAFRRAVNQLDPSRDTITLWVYPDAFELFRQLRDVLHQRGFQVAGRPLPADMPIRGSPTGSVSAVQ